MDYLLSLDNSNTAGTVAAPMGNSNLKNQDSVIMIPPSMPRTSDPLHRGHAIIIKTEYSKATKPSESLEYDEEEDGFNESGKRVKGKFIAAGKKLKIENKVVNVADPRDLTESQRIERR